MRTEDIDIISVDLECDGLLDHVSTIHMVGVLDLSTDVFHDYHGDDIAEGLQRIADADIILGHYFKGYDAPVISKLTGGLVRIDRSKIIDTCELSRELFPELPNHKLAIWGDLLDAPKGDHSDWSRYSPEMSVYCHRDCEIVAKIFEFMLETSV